MNFCENWYFANVNFVKSEFSKCEFLDKLRIFAPSELAYIDITPQKTLKNQHSIPEIAGNYQEIDVWKCEFCEKWVFKFVNFVKSEFSKCEFLDKLRIFAPSELAYIDITPQKTFKNQHSIQKLLENTKN